MSSFSFKNFLNDKLAQAFASKVELERQVTASGIPAPKEDFDSLVKSVRALKATVDKLSGAAGDPTEKALNIKDLINADIVAYSPSYGLSTTEPTFVTTPGGEGPPPDPGYDDPRPILTTPPTPVDLSVAGSFHSVILSWGLVDYQNHAYVEVWRNTSDNLGSAANIGTTTSNLFVDTTATPSTLYYYWVRAVNIEGVVGAFNAVNGTSGGPMLIGTTDLGPLIVEAGNLAKDAVTPEKVAAGAIDNLTKFAGGIEPVSVVGGALPTTKSTTVILWTGDLKMYRWNGGAYVKWVDAADITVNKLTAGQISSGAIGTDQLAANAVRTGNLYVTGRGAALNDDPGLMDPSAWTVENGTVSFHTGETLPGASGSYYIKWVSGTDTWVTSRRMPINPSKTYRLKANLYAAGGNDRNMYVFVRMWRADGTEYGAIGSGFTGWGGHLAGYVYGGLVTAGTYTRLGAQFGFNAGGWTIPADVVEIAVGVWFQYSGGPGTGFADQRVQDIRLEEAVAADLIVDGAIVAGKLSANAIVAGDGVIDTAAITNAMIDRATVDKLRVIDADIVDLNAEKVTFGQMHGDRIQTNTLNANAIAAGTLSANQIAFGSMSGDFITTNTLNGDRIIANTMNANVINTGTINSSVTFTGILNAATGYFTSNATPGTQKVSINESGSNEVRVYGSNGITGYELLASIGVVPGGGDYTIAQFGSFNSNRTGVAAESNSNYGIYGASLSGLGIYGQSSSNVGVWGQTAAYNSAGVRGANSGSGPGVLGVSYSGHAGEFRGNYTKAPLRIYIEGSSFDWPGAYSNAAKPTDRSVGSLAFIVTAGGNLRLCYADGTNWRAVYNNDIV